MELHCDSSSGGPTFSTRPNTVHHFQATDSTDGLSATFSCLSAGDGNCSNNNACLPPINNFFEVANDNFSMATSYNAPPVAHQQNCSMPAHIVEMLKAPANYYAQNAASYYSANPTQNVPPSAHQTISAMSLISSSSNSTMFFNNHATQFLTSAPCEAHQHQPAMYSNYQHQIFYPNYQPECVDDCFPPEVGYFQPDYDERNDAPLASQSEIAAALGSICSTSCLALPIEPAHQHQKKQYFPRAKRGPPPTESMIALASICDDVHLENYCLENSQSEVRTKRKYTRRKTDVGTSLSGKVERTGLPAAILQPEEQRVADTMLLTRFLTTSRDLPLVEVLREYSEYVAIKWRRFLSSDGERETIEPILFTCHVAECCFSTGVSSEIVRHMRTSNDCDECPKRFHTRQQLDTHVEAAHRVKIEEGGSLCDDCGLSFRNDTAFTYHKQHVHNVCPVCFFKAGTTEELTEHLAEQHQNFSLNAICTQCGARFMTVGQLSRHRVKEHQVATEETAPNANNGPSRTPCWANQRVKCQLCGKMLSNSSMRIHLRRKHNKEKRFKCEFCDFESFDTYMLKEHMRRHFAEYGYHCEYCDFVAVKKYQLQSHSRRHTGEKPFRCDKCNYSASWNVQLKSHIEVHKLPNPLICEPCNIYFRNQRQKDKHMATGHFPSGSGEVTRKSKPFCPRAQKLKVKLVKTAVSTKVENYTISRRSTTMRLRSSTKPVEQPMEIDNDEAIATPLAPKTCNYLIVNVSSNSGDHQASVACRGDDLMTIVCRRDEQFGPSSSIITNEVDQSQQSSYLILPAEML